MNDFLRWLFIVAFVVSFTIVECKSEKYIVNGNLTLDCSSFHGENITFFRSDNSTLINEKANILIIPNENLNHLNFNYSCKNLDGKIYKEFNKHPQFIKIEKRFYNILSNNFRHLIQLKTVNANCTWERKINESKWDLIPVNSTKYTMVDSQLIITLPDPNDSGFYRCRLENEFGENEIIIELKIKNQYWVLLPLVIILTQVFIFSILIITIERRQMRKKHTSEYSFEQSQLKQNPMA